ADADEAIGVTRIAARTADALRENRIGTAPGGDDAAGTRNIHIAAAAAAAGTLGINAIGEVTARVQAAFVGYGDLAAAATGAAARSVGKQAARIAARISRAADAERLDCVGMGAHRRHARTQCHVDIDGSGIAAGPAAAAFRDHAAGVGAEAAEAADAKPKNADGAVAGRRDR